MGRWDDRICVVLLNWNGKSDTIECLDSLQKCTYSKFIAIVVDNGSTDDSVRSIREAHPRTPIIQTKQNLGFAGGCNAGIDWALNKTFDWILLLNNDTVVAPDLFERFLDAAKAHPEAKIFGGKLLSYSEPTKIDHLGGRWNPKIAEFESLHSGEIDHPIEAAPAEYVCGAALFMHRIVPETIGPLEPNYFLFWEETDFCFRARRKGFEVWTAPEAKVWHKVSASFIGGKPHSHYFWTRSRLLWLHRNIPLDERRLILKKIIYPELWKSLRHYFYRWLQAVLLRRSEPAFIAKKKRLAAGVLGALDYYRGKFGNCPPWLTKK